MERMIVSIMAAMAIMASGSMVPVSKGGFRKITGAGNTEGCGTW